MSPPHFVKSHSRKVVRDLIELDPQEVTNFLGVSFRKDDQLIIDLIEASKDAAEECIGDIVPSQETIVDDMETYDVTADFAATWTPIGSDILTLEKSITVDGQRSIKLTYDASVADSGLEYTFPIATDLSGVNEIFVWIRGDEDNSGESIEMQIDDTGDIVVASKTVFPSRVTKSEVWTKFTLPVFPRRTVDGIDDIQNILIKVIPGDNSTGVLYIDRLGFTVLDDLPDDVKIGAMRWIANKYENRVSGVASDSEGGISKTYGDSIPEEWRNLRRIPV